MFKSMKRLYCELDCLVHTVQRLVQRQSTDAFGPKFFLLKVIL